MESSVILLSFFRSIARLAVLPAVGIRVHSQQQHAGSALPYFSFPLCTLVLKSNVRVCPSVGIRLHSQHSSSRRAAWGSPGCEGGG